MKILTNNISDYYDYHVKSRGVETGHNIPTWSRTATPLSDAEIHKFNRQTESHLSDISPLIGSYNNNKLISVLSLKRKTKVNSNQVRIILTNIIIGNISIPVVNVQVYTYKRITKPQNQSYANVNDSLSSKLYTTVTYSKMCTTMSTVNKQLALINDTMNCNVKLSLTHDTIICAYFDTKKINIDNLAYPTIGWNAQYCKNSNVVKMQMMGNIHLQSNDVASILTSDDVYNILDMFVSWRYSAENHQIQIDDKYIKAAHGFNRCSFKSCKRT